jgi:Tol biopolymer transport system component/tetratricopeptide (TPR) repeat protein
VDNRRFDEAMAILKTLLDGPREIAGAAHVLMVRVLRENGDLDAQKLQEIEEHRQKAEALLPQTAEAHFLQAMTALTVKEQLDALHEALRLDAKHYEARRLRAFTYYASRKYDELRDDALVMTILRPRDPLGYSLLAAALRELGKYDKALAYYDAALALAPNDSPQRLNLVTQRCETLLRMGRYEHVVTAAQKMLKLWPDKPVFQYHLFCARTALGDVNEAQEVFQQIVHSAPTARNEFWFWATKYVFDTLEAGQSWHRGSPAPTGAAFLPLVEAEETYRALSVKARRVLVGGFGAQWSPDGKKLAFSLGVQGYSGVALYDPATKETELLIVPGKDPRWSPDGRYLAFVRDRQALRLEELTSTERKDQERWLTNEEVWVMKSDGTEPRRLARGGWPSWSRDSAQVYYHSRQENMLCSISIAGSEVEPKRIMACPSAFPSVSPDEQQVAYLEYRSLKVKHLVSHAVVAQWRVPFEPWGGPAWSPTGKELCLGTGSSAGEGTGLWIYPLDSNEPTKVLTSQIMAASWAPDGTRLVFALRPPYFELWTVDLDPGVSAVKALGPGQTLADHWQDMLRLYTRRIETDPQDAYAYAERARCYDYLHGRTKAEADMRRWSAVMSGRSPSDLWFATRHGFRHVIDLPFDCELVFSAERPVNETPILNIAFGQKGRCEMKLFEIPLVAVSFLGSGLLLGFGAPSAHADFLFATPMNLGPTVNSSSNDYGAVVSPDGLELYFCSDRPGGRGGYDIWVTTRATTQDPWGPPGNLGAQINTSDWDGPWSMSPDGLTLYIEAGPSAEHLCTITRTTRAAPWGPRVSLGPAVNASSFKSTPIISPDGLELFFSSDRPGGYGDDIWVSTRATPSDLWGTPENLGPAVNSPAIDAPTWISPDGLTLLFFSTRAGGYGTVDTWITTRPSKGGIWSPARNLGPSVNTSSPELITTISSDGRSCYISDFGLTMWGPRPGGVGASDLWEAPVIPIVDFNADGNVDLVDLVMLIDDWGTDNTLCDIGPYAWGDGKVDIEDLKVFMTYYEKENPPKSQDGQ